MSTGNPAPGPAAELEQLAAALGTRGFDPVITSIGGRPVLVVSNPRVPALSENVLADAEWFWWPWGDRIARTADVDAAAVTVARVLAAVPEARES
jgi:hypothetical protein